MRLFGISLLPVLVAGIVFNLVSFVWYAFLFGDAWIVSHGYAEGSGHAGAPVWRLAGPLLAFAQVLALALVLKWRGWPDLAGTLETAVALWALIALPVLAYDTVNLPAHNVTAFLIDAGHLLAGWLTASIVLSVMRS